MAKTAQQLITRAYILSGAVSSGDAPTSDELSDGLEALNELITSWSEQHISIPYRTEDQITLVAGKSTYTLGTGGDVVTERPLAVHEAWLEDSNNQSYPFEITMMLREYSRISVKDLPERPCRGWYEPTYPLGTLRLDSKPEQAYTLHLWSLKQLTEFSALSTESTLPPSYDRALRSNLAIEIGGELGSPIDPRVVQMAEDSFRVIRNANLARRVSKLSTDNALHSRGRYDIYSDNT